MAPGIPLFLLQPPRVRGVNRYIMSSAPQIGRGDGREQHPAAPSAVRSDAVRIAQLLLSGNVGLIDGARALREKLTALGEYENGEFSGEFAALTHFEFESDPYPSESQRAAWSAPALAEADRWIPTLLSRHREPVHKACQRVVDKYGPQASGRRAG